ncbi:hypothetical protein [Streptosporangium sp. NPDC049644]|uniref:hypothetical protein n=1 Tax=Streptosporangium sp. NPDC049644 TaxID=3155507 RepID=UPI00341DA614
MADPYPLDSFFARRRRRLVDAYLGGSGQAADGTALFVQLPGAAATGLWGLSAIVVQIDGSGNDRLLPLALGLFVLGLVPGIIVIWRRRAGPRRGSSPCGSSRRNENGRPPERSCVVGAAGSGPVRRDSGRAGSKEVRLVGNRSADSSRPREASPRPSRRRPQTTPRFVRAGQAFARDK